MLLNYTALYTQYYIFKKFDEVKHLQHIFAFYVLDLELVVGLKLK